jgi:hypothetical protein
VTFKAPLTGVAGRLPVQRIEPVSTPWFDIGKAQALMAVQDKTIATFSGMSGTGKTTTAVYLARQTPVRFVYVKLKHRAGTKEVATALFKALHGGQNLSGRVNESDYIDECTDTLLAGNIGVIADEVHYIGVPGMLLLAQVWDSVNCYMGEGFPLFLVGAEVNEAVAVAPELATRVGPRATFYPLDGDDLLSALRAMDPRCAATPSRRLEKVDRLFCHGLLRLWKDFIEAANRDPARAGEEISAAEVRGFLTSRGVRGA